MLEMTIQVPEPLAVELMAKSGRLPEVLAYGLQQLPPLPNETYQYILEFLVSQPSPAEVMHFGPAPAMQTRIAELLEKNRMGMPTAEESAEFDEYLRINHLITMLKARALPYLTPEN